MLGVLVHVACLCVWRACARGVLVPPLQPFMMRLLQVQQVEASYHFQDGVPRVSGGYINRDVVSPVSARERARDSVRKLGCTGDILIHEYFRKHRRTECICHSVQNIS